MQHIVIPPKCIGIMGGGQLGSMLAISAKQMGYKVAVLEPDENCPAKQFADYHIRTNYNDQHGLDQLASYSSVITTEFENVPSQSMQYLSRHVPTYPNHKIISTAQNRLEEKDFFNSLGIHTTKYKLIEANQLTHNDVIDKDLFPAILKTNTLGYDGKGQIYINNSLELIEAFNKLGKINCILEQVIKIKKEVSIIIARNSLGIQAFPVVENVHKNAILDISIVRRTVSETIDCNRQKINNTITQYAIDIVNKLDYIGVLAIEFFVTEDDQILANEMAPRPHNSGHYTLDACFTSQFEQQLRSICNLKLGATTLSNNAIMLNLLGDIWCDKTPNWDKILTHYSNIKLHMYGKKIAKIGRKMGHLTLLGENIDILFDQLSEIRSILGI